MSHLHQEFSVHCIVIGNDGGSDRWGMVDSYQGVGGRTGSGYYPIVFFISLFVFSSLMSCLFFKGLEHDSCLFLCLLFAFVVSGPFN